MEKGLRKYWTPELDEMVEHLLGTCHGFANQHMLMALRNGLKYDMRTRQGKRAMAQIRLNLALASDAELEELARFEHDQLGANDKKSAADRLTNLMRIRQQVRERGVPELRR